MRFLKISKMCYFKCTDMYIQYNRIRILWRALAREILHESVLRCVLGHSVMRIDEFLILI